ncbi:hypothetical protein JHJ32_09170 [Parapedobacter sp. ISTM3]|uniref:hypothetical protein n=1 Tax=Parapedobacter sp. ISTM3 TaxID=2800130 RepID=UPI001905E862|nr:hypothetical protein [Parapedobacter sp. ISTM3]MBK1440154.1 hypothetical protein [Parapedobacter sp. ISTM3]
MRMIKKKNRPTAVKLLTRGLLFCSSFVWACTKTEPMVKEAIDFISLKRLNDCPAIVMDTQLSDGFIVVNTREELEQSIFVANDNPDVCELLKEELAIDFTKHTLLIGKRKISHVQGGLISEEVYRSDDKTYTYRVVIKNGGYTALGLFRFGVIIGKIPKGTDVNLDVVIQDRL